MKLILILFILISGKVQSYPNFIGHSYTSCLNCHFNPFGGGALTDYGRAVSATTISAKPIYPSSEEQLAYTSGFLFRSPKQDHLRTQINYRGFNLVRNPGSTKSEVKQWINMQADARMVLKFGENDKYILSTNFAYTPPPSYSPPGTKHEEWKSREYYLGYRVTPKLGFYAGLMDKVYGLRIVEHVAYSRTTPGVTQNTQTMGLVTHYLGDTWEGGLHFFQGNPSEEKNQRMKGFSGTFEKTVLDGHRIGLSLMQSKNETIDLTSYAIHGRFNLKEGSSLMFELGKTDKTPDQTKKIESQYALLQTSLRPMRGLYLLSNIEYLQRDTNKDSYTVRWGPAIQYFPMQRVELRLDVYNTRNLNEDSSSRDSWMYLVQTHIWL